MAVLRIQKSPIRGCRRGLASHSIFKIRQMQKLVSPLIACSLASAVFLPSVSAVDIVERASDRATFRGEFTKLGPDVIIVKRTNGEEVSISVADLKKVQFDGEPTELTPARSNERSGALDVALEKFLAVQKSGAGKDPRLRKELEFLIARVKGKQALLDPAQADPAIEALTAFRSANKTHYRYLEATLLQASIHGVKGQADEGRTLLTEVQQSTVERYQLQAGVDLGRLLLSSGSAPEAQAAFDDVIAKSTGKPESAGAMYDGMLGKALCLKQQNQIDEAVKTLDAVIKDAPPSETRTLAEAWVRKGDCFRQKQQPKPALMAYLHVDVLYSGEAAQHAEALLRLTELWGPSGYQNRAVEASAKLVEKYPNSQWAKKAGGGG